MSRICPRPSLTSHLNNHPTSYPVLPCHLLNHPYPTAIIQNGPPHKIRGIAYQLKSLCLALVAISPNMNVVKRYLVMVIFRTSRIVWIGLIEDLIVQKKHTIAQVI